MPNYLGGKTVKRCFHCGKLYKPYTIQQKYCNECIDERMELFAKNRTWKVCPSCRSTFLSVGGNKYCPRCKEIFGK